MATVRGAATRRGAGREQDKVPRRDDPGTNTRPNPALLCELLKRPIPFLPLLTPSYPPLTPLCSSFRVGEQTYLIERHVYLLRAQVGAYGRRDASSASPQNAVADESEEFIAFLLHLSKFITLHSRSPRMLVLPLSRSVANLLIGYFIGAIVALTSFVVRLAFDGAAA